MSLKKLGRYDLVRVLGKGAMGIVYEGRDPNLDRRVAIKTVKVESLSEQAASEYELRFRTEARSAARLQHPNIVSVYDSDRDGDVAFLVMEYIQGDDLKHHLDQGKRYSLEQSLKMLRDLLSALEYAHKHGIVHRDIKPANLLIEPGGRVKLTDFGVARMQDSGDATRTQGNMIGTLKYMSPEQVQGFKTDARSDLFSVGVVLYQLLTDTRPFDGDNDFSIIHQIIEQTPVPPSSINPRLPPAIDAVVARALAKDREQRFATARDFASALQSATRRAQDATVVPPPNPSKKAEGAGAASNRDPDAPHIDLPTGTSTVTQEIELAYWKEIRESLDPEELEGFLVKFPAGIYADLARRRLRKLSSWGPGLPDQTILDGNVVPPGSQDPTVPSPSAAEPASDFKPAAVEVPTAPVPAPRGRPSLVALAASLGALAAVGIAAVMMMGQGGGDTSTAAAPASAPSAAASTVAVPAMVPAVSPAAGPHVPASAVAAKPAEAAATTRAAAAHRPAASARHAAIEAKSKSASQAIVESRAEEPPSARHRDEPRAIRAPVVVAATAPNPVEICREKVFLSKEFCLAEQCDQPGARNHPLCVQRRQDAKLREESKVRY
ncbi:MAG TPA: serine/threonine-protein kinase [Ramlibacter sp.]|nr:serine/threonine-protein kinase [Ramlibacter sp.]